MKEKHAVLRADERHLRLSHPDPGQLECYMALGVLHQLCSSRSRAVSGLHRHPQAQRLPVAAHHAGGPAGNAPVEFQIRTEGMHRMVRRRASPRTGSTSARARTARARPNVSARWLQSLIDIQDETRDASEFLEHVKIDLFPDAVYVFTPVKQDPGPAGRTPVDFAYAIHSDVGEHCVAARSTASRAPAGRVAQRRCGRDRHRAQRPPQPSLAQLCAHRARAQQDPSLPEKPRNQEESHDLGVKLLAQAMRAEGLPLPSRRPGTRRPPRCGSNSTPGPVARNVAELFIDIGWAARSRPSWPRSWRACWPTRPAPDAVSLTWGVCVRRVASPGRVTIDGSEGASVHWRPAAGRFRRRGARLPGAW